jgi:S1-C subfamily serine protease
VNARGVRAGVAACSITAFTIAACLVLASCSVIPTAPSDLPDEWVPSVSPSAIPSESAASDFGYTDAENAAVRVRNVGCDGLATGSGFVLDEHTIVTNHHVVASTGRLEVTLADGTDITVTASKYATNGDFALISTEESLAYAVTLAQTDAETGDSITVVGYPDGGVLTVSEGIVEGSDVDTLDNASFVQVTTAYAAPGSSGSAVYNEAGEVIGVLYAGSNETDETLIVPLSLLKAFLTTPTFQVDNPPACMPAWL